MKEVTKLTDQTKGLEVEETVKIIQTESTTNENICKTNICNVCDYLFKAKVELDNHMEKHKIVLKVVKKDQKCHLCFQNFLSDNDFKKHVRIKHVQYNCNQCDFQAGTKLVLSKHTNLTHTKRR